MADAYARDTLELIDMGFATFARGIYCADALGRIRVDAADVPIECGGVTVHAGDLVLADHDGVVVIPSAIAEEAIELAEAKVAGENESATPSPAACRSPRRSQRSGCSSRLVLRTLGVWPAQRGSRPGCAGRAPRCPFLRPSL